MKFHLLATLTVGILFSTGALQDEAQKDLDRMQGTWDAVSLVEDGKLASPEHVRGAKLTVKGHQYEMSGEQSYRGTLKLDPTQKPRAIEATYVEVGSEQKGRAHGVYAFEGDQLKISWRQASAERPTDFNSTSGSKVRAMVFRHSK